MLNTSIYDSGASSGQIICHRPNCNLLLSSFGQSDSFGRFIPIERDSWIRLRNRNALWIDSIESLRRTDSIERLCESNPAATLCPRGDWLHMIPLNVHYLLIRLHSVFIKQTIWRMVLVHVGYLVLPVFGSVRNRGIYNTLNHDKITSKAFCLFNVWLLNLMTDLYVALGPYWGDIH